LRVVERIEQLFNQAQHQDDRSSSSAPLVLLQAQYLASVLWNKLGYQDRAIKVSRTVLTQVDAALPQLSSGALEVDATLLSGMKSLRTMTTITLCTSLHDKVKEELHDGRYRAARSLLAQAVPLIKDLEQLDGLDQVAVWKLAGDIYTAHYHTRDISADGIAVGKDGANQRLLAARSEALGYLKQGARAYLRATQLDRDLHSLYQDLAINYYWQAKLLMLLPSVEAPNVSNQQASTSKQSQPAEIYAAGQSEHLLMFDEAILQIQRAIVAAPVPQVASARGGTTDTAIVRYLTVLGVIVSEYHSAVEAATWTLPPSLTRLPIRGADSAQRAFSRAAKLANALAVTSDGFYAPHAAFVWSNMITHWLCVGVDRETLHAAAQHARNLDPTSPVPWIVLATTRFSTKAGDTKQVLRDELNNLEHALLLSPNVDYAVVTLGALVYRLHRGDEYSHSYSSSYSNIQHLTAGLLRMSAVHLEKYLARRGAHLAPTLESASAFNLLGLLYSQLGMYHAASQQFHAALRAWQSATTGSSASTVTTVRIFVNLAQSLEHQQQYAEASAAYNEALGLLPKEASSDSTLLHLAGAAQVGLVRCAVTASHYTPPSPSPSLSPAPWKQAVETAAQLSGTPSVASAALRLLLAKLGHFADAKTTAPGGITNDAWDLAMSAMVAMSHQVGTASQWQLTATTAATGVALALLRHDDKVADARMGALRSVITELGAVSAACATSVLDHAAEGGSSVAQLQAKARARHADVAHQAAWQMYHQLQHYRQLLSWTPPASAGSENSGLLVPIQRAIHLAPWKLENWLHLAADATTSTKRDDAIGSTTSLTSVPLSVVSPTNPAWTEDEDYSPVSALKLQLQHDYLRYKRAMLLHHDVASHTTSEQTTEQSLPVELTPEQLEAIALAEAEAEEAAQMGMKAAKRGGTAVLARAQTPSATSPAIPPAGSAPGTNKPVGGGGGAAATTTTTSSLSPATPASPAAARKSASSNSNAGGDTRQVVLRAACRLAHLAPWLRSGWLTVATVSNISPSSLANTDDTHGRQDPWPTTHDISAAAEHVVASLSAQTSSSELPCFGACASSADLPQASSSVAATRAIAHTVASSVLLNHISAPVLSTLLALPLAKGATELAHVSALVQWLQGNKSAAVEQAKTATRKWATASGSTHSLTPQLVQLARMYAATDKPSAATYIMDWLASASPNDAGTLTQQAWILYCTGQAVAASQVAEKAAALAPQQQPVLALSVILVLCYAMLGKKNKVTPLMERLTAQHPSLAALVSSCL
jgi:tetratricopeptide (TPR) repeat protein